MIDRKEMGRRVCEYVKTNTQYNQLSEDELIDIGLEAVGKAKEGSEFFEEFDRLLHKKSIEKGWSSEDKEC